MMPPYRCSTCHQLTTGPCPTCQRSPWHQPQPSVRIRGRKLQTLRRRLFCAQPWCRLCLAKTPQRFTFATIRDHVVPLAEGGTDTDDNIQPLCIDCSDAKTANEATRGHQRAWQ